MMWNKAGKASTLVFSFLIFILLLPLSSNAGTDLNQQIQTLAKKLASVAQGEVLKADERKVYINLGQNQGILPGNQFEIIRQGEPLKFENEIVGYEETLVAKVEVHRARDYVSVCNVLENSGSPLQGDKAYQLRKKINTLVVGQFTCNDGFNRLTKSIQEKLVTAMANRGMKVVERSQLEKVLKEQKLGYSGLVNTGSAKKIGELLGADGILLGTVSDMGNTITINARMVDIGSGNAVTASEVELPKTPLIARMLETTVESVSFETQSSAHSSGPENKDKREKKGQTKEVDNFVFELKECKKSGQSVHCAMMITNNGPDRTLGINNSTRMFDDLGNAYGASNLSIASCISRSVCHMDFVRGVPIKASVSFQNVEAKASMAPVVEVGVYVGNSGYKLQYRDVTFSR